MPWRFSYLFYLSSFYPFGKKTTAFLAVVFLLPQIQIANADAQPC